MRLAGFSQHRWYGSQVHAKARQKAKIAVVGAAADTVLLCQSPAPVGWPRVTGFLAGSTQFEDPVETDEGVYCRVVARAAYASIINKKTQTLNQNGDAMGATIAKRFRDA